MPGGYKDFTAATALSADVDNFLMRQTIMRFASTAARDSDLAGVLEDGMFCVTLDTHSIWMYTGSAWFPIMSPWTTYTPTWTNLTLNSGTTNSARYRYIMGDLRVRGQVTLAADSAIVGTVSHTIPLSLTADSGWTGGVGLANDAGTRLYPCVVGVTPSGTTFSWVHAETGGVVTGTAPFTWATGDQLTWDITIGVA